MPCASALAFASAIAVERAIANVDANGSTSPRAHQPRGEHVHQAEAGAQALANQKLSASLTPALVQDEAIKRWNGVRPTVEGSGGGLVPLIQLPLPTPKPGANNCPTRRTGMLRLLVIGLGWWLWSAAPAAALELVSAPVRVFNGDTFTCLVTNAGSTLIGATEITVKVNAPTGALVSSGRIPCGTLSPLEVCPLEATIPAGVTVGWCVVSYPGGRLRANACNVTRGLCVDLR